MLTDIQVFQSLEKTLPIEIRPAILRRMRRVEPLWSALHDEEFIKKAVSFAGNDPERWRPGLLGLLLGSEIEYLRARFPKSGPAAVRIPEGCIQRAESALQKGGHGTIEQAALAALSLAAEPGRIPAETPVLVWICLYSILIDPAKAVDALAARLPETADTLANVVLTNEAADRAAEILERCIPAAGIAAAAALCEAANALDEPEIARRLGAAITGRAVSASADQPENRILRARMLRLAGEPGAALPEADAARRDAKRILLETLMESAHAAEAEENFSTALSFWQEASALSPAAAGIRAGIARSLAGLGRNEEALAALPASSEDPEDLLLLARIRLKSGAHEKAAEAVRLASMKGAAGGPAREIALAEVLTECGDVRGAAQILTAAGRAWPNHPQIFARLAGLHAQSGDWHACATAASSAWNLHPDDRESLRLLAQSAEHEGRSGDAADYFQLLAEKSADDPAVLLALAQTSLAAGDPARAHQAAERTLALRPNCGEAHAILGLIDLSEGKADNAFTALQKATRLSPKAAAPWKALADLHAARGNREAAATTLRAGIEAASEPADLLLALGRMLNGEGRFREAAETLERALNIRPSDTAILIALAEAAFGRRQTADAEEYLRRALAIAPGLTEAVRKLAALLNSLGRSAEARTVLERAVAAEPQSAELLVELGSLLLDLYRSDPDSDPALAGTALALLEQAEGILAGKTDLRMQTLIAWARIFAGRIPEAVSLFSSLLQTAEDLTLAGKVDAHKGLAEAMIRSGDFPTAVHNLQAALQLDGADCAARLRLAEALAASGLQEDALNAYRKLLADKPDSVPALIGSAEALAAQKRNEESVAALRQAAELAPADAGIPMRLAEIHWQSGNGAEARVEMAKALEIAQPPGAGIALRAGRLLSAMKEFGEAASVLEKALAGNPSSIALLTDLGEALQRSGRNAPAFEMHRRASELEPAQTRHLAAAADALWADGRKSAALAFLKKAVQIEPENIQLVRRLAGGLHAVGFSGESLPHFEKAVALAPDDASLALEAAQAAFRAGDLDRAEAWKDSAAAAASNSAEGPILHARIALEKEDIVKAVEACQSAVTAHPADGRGWALLAQALGRRAEAERRSGRDEKETADGASSALAKAAELCAESPEAMRLTGRAALELGKLDVAVACLGQLTQSVPEDAEAHALLAKAAILQAEAGYRLQLAGVFDPPAASAEKTGTALARAGALGASDEDLQTLYARAALAFAAPHPDAIESLAALNQNDPSPDVAAAVAQAWLRIGNAEAARKAAESAVGLQPDGETGRLLLGVCEWKTGRLESALDSLRQAIRLAPHQAIPHALAAAVLHEMNRPDEAIAEIRAAADASPGTAAFQHTLGVWEESEGDRAAALPHHQRAVELDPRNGEYRRSLARALLRDGDPAGALVHYRESAAMLPEADAGLFAEIGKAAIDSGRPAEAYEAYQTAREQSGTTLPAAWRLGKARAALALGNREEARAIAKEVLHGEGHPPEARMILAEVEEAEGRLPEAIRHLDLAASEMSDPVQPALRLARLWTATGAATRSVAAMQALIEANPENAEAHHRLAEAQLESGRMEDALRSGQKAAELAPRNPANWILLGKISRRMGQLDQSLAALSRAREIAPHDYLPALECGLTYEAEQRWDLALDTYRSALKIAPHSAELHYRLGVVHKNLRAYPEAADALRQAVQIEPHNLAAHKLLSGVMALSLVYGAVPRPADAR
jgi:tetratricopeptide (TPR) repeat protein